VILQFPVRGFRFAVLVPGSEFAGSGVLSSGFFRSRFRVRGSGSRFRVDGSGFTVPRSRFRVRVLGSLPLQCSRDRRMFDERASVATG
jgi:hypothetical protein